MAESIELTVTGMKCGGCEANVKSKLGTIDGVLSVTASSKDKKVGVAYDAAKTNLEAIKTAIAEAGFSVE
jgi:copper chaperone